MGWTWARTETAPLEIQGILYQLLLVFHSFWVNEMTVGWMGMRGGDGHVDNLLAVIPQWLFKKVVGHSLSLISFYFCKNTLFLHYCRTNITAVLCFAIYIANLTWTFRNSIIFLTVMNIVSLCDTVSKCYDIRGRGRHMFQLSPLLTPLPLLPLKHLPVGMFPPPAPIPPSNTIHKDPGLIFWRQRV